MLAVITEELFAPLKGLDPMDQVKAPLGDRYRFAVDSIWIWYNNSRYPAVWDIILAARHDAELMASIRAWRVAAAKELDAAVVKLFPEFAFTPERLKNLQHFVTSHLRGVRFMRIYEDHRLEIDEQLRLLAEALRQMVEATPRKQHGSPDGGCVGHPVAGGSSAECPKLSLYCPVIGTSTAGENGGFARTGERDPPVVQAGTGQRGRRSHRGGHGTP